MTGHKKSLFTVLHGKQAASLLGPPWQGPTGRSLRSLYYRGGNSGMGPRHAYLNSRAQTMCASVRLWTLGSFSAWTGRFVPAWPKDGELILG